MIIIAPVLSLVVPYWIKLAPLLKITKLPVETVSAPSKVTLSPDLIVTDALFTVNLQALKSYRVVVPGEVKVPDMIAAVDAVGAPLLHAVPFQVVVVAEINVIVTDAHVVVSQLPS